MLGPRFHPENNAKHKHKNFLLKKIKRIVKCLLCNRDNVNRQAIKQQQNAQDLVTKNKDLSICVWAFF